MAQSIRADQRQSGAARPSVNSIPRAAPEVVKRTSDYFRTFQVPRIQLRSMQDCESALSEFDGARRDFDTRLSAFLNGPKDERAMLRAQPQFESQLARAQINIKLYSDAMMLAGKRSGDTPVAPLAQDVCFAKTQRAEIMRTRQMAVAIGRLFPNLATPSQVIADADQSLGRSDTEAKILEIVNSNRGATAASNRLPAPLSTNPEWIAAFRAHFNSAFPGWAYLGQSVYSSQWYIHRNLITEVPEYRQIGTRIAARAPDGTCSIIKFDRYESWSGSSFGSPRFEKGLSSLASCANLP